MRPTFLSFCLKLNTFSRNLKLS